MEKEREGNKENERGEEYETERGKNANERMEMLM